MSGLTSWNHRSTTGNHVYGVLREDELIESITQAFMRERL